MRLPHHWLRDGALYFLVSQRLVARLDAHEQAVEKVLDDKVRPNLLRDGGNLEVVDMKEAGEGFTDIYINYLGACKGCPSAAVGTLTYIEEFLKTELDQKIRVLPV